MAAKYDPKILERRWQERWEAERRFEVDTGAEGERFYALEMFPYPSGTLHMGHIRVYSIGDVLARYRMVRGDAVLHPMGWDALGLPAENAAIKDGVHPAKRTRANIEAVREQMKAMGWGYDWSREFATCDPEYYRWNQWFFLEMLQRDLVYRKTDASVNWCPSCETVIANEQAEGGLCERCGTEIDLRTMPEWAFRITRYADELLDDLDKLPDWPERVKTMQRNWIGKSYGAEADFAVQGADPIRVFTTRLDTIYGCTFMVLAPEHARVLELTAPDLREEVEAFRKKVAKQDHAVRTAEDAPKEGVYIGRDAINPYTGEAVPIWIANFVLADYGTGAVMSVPGHDTRDFAFAKRHGIPIRTVIEPEPGEWGADHALEEAFTADGYMTGSGEHSGLSSEEGRRVLAALAEERGFGKATVNYHLRDWGISRQRYWGTPIPVVHCDDCGVVPVPRDELPVVLPEDVSFTGKGGSPLARVEEFVSTRCPVCGKAARRETDTMDTFVDSAWYYARYVDPHNDAAPFDRDRVDAWVPVTLYVGGPEHAVMHLLYFRFWHKVMRDLGLVSTDEPVERLLTQGMVCNQSFRCLEHGYIKRADLGGTEDAPTCPHCGEPVERKLDKMSKSKANGVSPDGFIERFGADAMRLFILFAAPPEKDLEWSDQGPEGTFRFLRRVHDLFLRHAELIAPVEGAADPAALDEAGQALWRKIHGTIAKVTDDIERSFQFNTAIAALMELLNEATRFEPREGDEVDRALIGLLADSFARLVGPFAPHLAEELWAASGHEESLLTAGWPIHDPAALELDRVVVPVQVNGKVRAQADVAADADDEAVRAAALAEENVQRHLEGQEPRKVIVVRRKGKTGTPKLVSVVK